ncbi:TRAP transporter small permease [Ostreiculturibacter nitratireducens]|uniref:TRAP transporter small permease n=1 Tax=Ostreiculturibacter nitratireducens TaxID=3075226 RepID=UPI0031B6324E
MQMLERAADRVAQGLALIGALGVVAMLLHVGADVVARNLFDRPIPATNEIVSRYYMVLIAFLPLAWVERGNAMVSVELLDMAMPPGLRRVSDLLVALIASVIYAAIAWVTLQSALSEWRVGSFVDVLGREVPVWPTYFLPPAGFCLAALVTLLRAAHSVRGQA